MDSGTAIAASLSFRLVTFWLPLPIGAWAWETLRRRGRPLGLQPFRNLEPVLRPGDDSALEVDQVVHPGLLDECLNYRPERLPVRQ